MDYFDYSKIPDYMMININNYVENGYPMGSFLTAIFSNDLYQAVAKADDINKSIIPIYIHYLINELPCNSYGSNEIVSDYIKSKSVEKMRTFKN